MERSPRQTRQQHAVLDAIAHSGRCLNAAEVWELARGAVPSLNLSTVYRQLKALHEQSQVTRVELPGEAPRFEAVCATREAHQHDHHHHHFHCTACERVFPLHACPGSLDSLLPGGFTLQRHDLTLHGHCADCSGGARA